MTEPKFPEHIMKMLRMREGLEPDDTSMDDVFASMTGYKAVHECTAWELGDGFWFRRILKWIEDCGGEVVWSDQS